MNTSQKGNLAQSKVIARFSELGYNVCLPFGDGYAYDLILDKENALFKVQVKLGRLRNGVIVFNCCSTTRDFTSVNYKGKADLFAVFCPETGGVYLFPVDESGEKTVHLRIEKSKRICLRTRHAYDYLL